MGITMYYQIKCEICGKFCKPYDKGVYYGGCLDLEPPDPVYFCNKCADSKAKDPQKVIVNCWWIKPNFVRVAKCINRHRNRQKHEK